jgi:hypothetical protein
MEKEKILTITEEKNNSMRARLRILQSLDSEIAEEIRNWYDWERMTPAYIIKVANRLMVER